MSLNHTKKEDPNGRCIDCRSRSGWDRSGQKSSDAILFGFVDSYKGVIILDHCFKTSKRFNGKKVRVEITEI